MKWFVNIARVLVGGLFIFSGLVKAIDPLGLSYKMQEFFDVWKADGHFPGLMAQLNNHALTFSVIMIALEVIAGFALLIGFKKNITTWLLLLLTLFFTFLTAFVLFTGKIRACGCFGDCIPLTPIQTFTKDIVLTVLIIIILLGRKYIQPLFKTSVAAVITLLVLALVLFLQYYVIKHLPLKDCLPFKAGNNILELRKMPKDAVQPKYEFVFIYEKNGEKKEFTVSALPDSTWTFVDRSQKLIEKGKNNVPLINDFSLNTPDTFLVYQKDGAEANYSVHNIPDSSWVFKEKKSMDSTETILSHSGEYYLLFIKDVTAIPADWAADLKVISAANTMGKPVYVISSDYEKTTARFSSLAAGNNKITVPVYTCDATALKTSARNNVTLYLMNGPVVQKKWGGNDISNGIKTQ